MTATAISLRANKKTEESSIKTFYGVAGILRKCQPIWFVLENVESIADKPGDIKDSNLDLFVDDLRGCGYYVQARVLVATDYQSPQTRRRVRGLEWFGTLLSQGQ